jgi:hypothetical protein
VKYRFLRRRASIGTPRMTIRQHVPWPARIGLGVVAVFAALVGGFFVGRMEIPEQGAQRQAEIARLRQDKESLRAERDRVIASQAPIDSQAVMDRSTLVSLAEQVKRLETDNARLKDDVSFFEGATGDRQGKATSKGVVSIARFQVTQDRATHLARFRVLVTQDSRAAQGFTGDLQLSAVLQRGGKAVTIVLPANASQTPQTNADLAQIDGDPAQFRIVFKSYRRIDGSFRFASDASLVSVQARILDRGAVAAQQTVVVE